MPTPLSEDRQGTLSNYTRLKHSETEVATLRNRGFVPVISSNVSAVARQDEMLIVRFHGGATYAYPRSGDRYEDILSAPSKGKFVWNELRRKRVPYYRTGRVTIEDDVSDRDLMRADIDTDVQINTLVDKDRAAVTVSVSQERARETVVDIIPRARPTLPSVVEREQSLALAGLVGVGVGMTQGIIAGLVLARLINNSRQA